jgi:hypothetical protein
MPNTNTKPDRATVRRGLQQGKKAPDFVAAVTTVCSAGAQCPEVTGSQVGAQALGALQSATTKAQGSLSAKEAAVLALLAAIKVLRLDLGALRGALGAYEGAVQMIAAGNASIINKAGLLSRDAKPAAAALGKVTGVHSKPGKLSMEAIVGWPAVPGATGYAIEVNFTPQNASATWTALPSGSSRRRVLKAPTAGAQFLARIAAVASDGTQSDWSDVILATAR